MPNALNDRMDAFLEEMGETPPNPLASRMDGFIAEMEAKPPKPAAAPKAGAGAVAAPTGAGPAAGAEPEPDDTKGFFESLGHGLARGTIETARAAIEATPRMATEQLETLAKTFPGVSGMAAGLQVLRDLGIEGIPDVHNITRTAIEKVYGVGFNKWTADKLREIKDAHPEWEPQKLASIEDLLSNPMALVEQIAATVPYMGGSIVAHALGGPGLAFQFAYAIEGQNAYEEAIRTGATPEQAEAQAQLVGGINGLIEMMQVRQVINFSKAGKRLFIDAALAAARKKLAAKGVLAVAGRVAKGAIGLAIGEGMEEVLQGTTEELAARGIQGREIPEGFFERRAIEGIIGGLAGLIFGAGGRAISTVAGRGAAAPPAAPEAEAAPARELVSEEDLAFSDATIRFAEREELELAQAQRRQAEQRGREAEAGEAERAAGEAELAAEQKFEEAAPYHALQRTAEASEAERVAQERQRQELEVRDALDELAPNWQADRDELMAVLPRLSETGYIEGYNVTPEGVARTQEPYAVSTQFTDPREAALITALYQRMREQLAGQAREELRGELAQEEAAGAQPSEAAVENTRRLVQAAYDKALRELHQDLEAENPILLVGRQEVGIPEPPSWPMMRFMERAAATQEAVAAAEA
ncbi:MAG TPA: hypothetical protein VMY35_11970, partial [Phycisphaerae bacterium]|nr:hypothetical protein [Phycisphaerae bacterium]